MNLKILLKLIKISLLKILLADYKTFTKDIVTSKIKSEGLVNKSPVAGFINIADLDKKASNITSKS